ncbi:MAG: DNA repair protein RadC [Clostridia bacterium]|nr:DNA repair protein RadC [Clostridia bacterium]MBR3152196.1 DNA repair protein RadC [Clostridia bacterium]MBR3152267.1 DNA repair protein RadC [Clostridia bacterium]
MALKLKELPLSERPYEKLILYGAENLTNVELLAIIIESGTKEETSISLAQKILKLAEDNDENNLRFLQNCTVEEFMKIKGIGKVKAIRLKAISELTKRMSKPIKNEIFVKSSKDVVDLIMDEMRYEKNEVVKIILLNSKNKVLRIKDISIGTTSYAVIDPKDILSEAIKIKARKMIITHNHPSGNPTPSKDDYELTKRIDTCCKLFEIELLDHIVIGDGIYKRVEWRH